MWLIFNMRNNIELKSKSIWWYISLHLWTWIAWEGGRDMEKGDTSPAGMRLLSPIIWFFGCKARASSDPNAELLLIARSTASEELMGRGRLNPPDLLLGFLFWLLQISDRIPTHFYKERTPPRIFSKFCVIKIIDSRDWSPPWLLNGDWSPFLDYFLA